MPGNWISWLRMTWSDVRLPWSIFSNSKCLLMTYLEPDISSPSVNPKGSLMGVISEAASSALFEITLSIHMGYDEPLQDETIVRIKVFL